MDPHRMRGIGEPPVGKRVGGEQVAEFIVNERLGDRHDRQSGRASHEGRESDHQHRGPPPERQLA